MELRTETDFTEDSILIRMFDGDKQVAVLFALETSQHRYSIEYLFVTKTYRRQGLGSELLKIGYNELMQRGAWFDMIKWTESQEALLLANGFYIQYEAKCVPYLTNCGSAIISIKL